MASKCVFDTLFYFGFAVCLLPLLLLPRTLSLSRSRSLSLSLYISLSLSVAVTGTLAGVNVGVNRFASLKVKPRRLDTCVITFDGFYSNTSDLQSRIEVHHSTVLPRAAD